MIGHGQNVILPSCGRPLLRQWGSLGESHFIH
jgi:hypothetical protein